MYDQQDMHEIRRNVNRLRLCLRLWQLGVGTSRLLGVMTALLLLSLAVDRGLRMDHAQRLLAVIAGVIALVILAWRWMVRPLCRPVSTEALLLHVERCHPDLKYRLVAAWEFAAMPAPPPGTSTELMDATIQQGLLAAKESTFRSVLDWARFRRRTRLGCVALAVLLTLVIGASQTMHLWYARNILLRDVEWPRRTHLRVQGLVAGVLRVAKEDDLVVLVRAEGVQPREVMFRYADDAGAAYSEQMPLVGSVYRTVFSSVTEPFRLQVSGGDDRTDWIPVELLSRPVITEVTVTVEPPAYTGREQTRLDARMGTFAVPAGSRVVLHGRVSLPVREVNVVLDGQPVQTLCLTNATSFAMHLPPEQVKTATYRLQALSASGVPTLHPTLVVFRAEPDRPPRVTATLHGIGQMVLPRAVVPVVCEFQDDYGVSAAWLEYQSQSPTGGNSGVIQAPIPLPASSSTGGVSRVNYTLELTSLGLEADATIALRAAARDGNTLSGPGQGQSSSYTLRVVTEETLRQDLVRREQLLRQQMERVIQEQSALADESKLFYAGEEKPKDQDIWRFLQAEKRQRQIPQALAAIVTGLTQIRREAYNNRLDEEPSPLRKRLEEQALAPLRSVDETLLPEAGECVAAARQTKAAGKERDAAWRATEDAQRRVVAALQDVLKNMLASEDVSDLMRLMDEILTDQKRINQETDRKAGKAVEDVFEK
jgi:hypothetical protein